MTEKYHEISPLTSFLNVEGVFERAESAARAGSKRSGSNKGTGEVITRFVAKNGNRIFLETVCKKKKKKFIFTYMVSCMGVPSDHMKDRKNALDYIKEIGGYRPIRHSVIPSKGKHETPSKQKDITQKLKPKNNNSLLNEINIPIAKRTFAKNIYVSRLTFHVPLPDAYILSAQASAPTFVL